MNLGAVMMLFGILGCAASIWFAVWSALVTRDDREDRRRKQAGEDISYRLSYRLGQLQGDGLPWRARDRRLLEDAISEIHRLRFPAANKMEA